MAVDVQVIVVVIFIVHQPHYMAIIIVFVTRCGHCTAVIIMQEPEGQEYLFSSC
jgi:hypothetical protein